MKKLISIVGDSIIEKGGDKYRGGVCGGWGLGGYGSGVAGGGRGGVTAAAAEGAHDSEFYTDGGAVGVLLMFN